MISDYAQYAIVGLTLGCIYALVALGFYFVFRATGVLDFAQGEKAILGGLLALSLHDYMPLALAAVATTAIGLVLGVVYGTLVILPTYRRPGLASVVATVGAALAFFFAEQLIWGPHAQPFPSFPGPDVSLWGVRVDSQSFWVWGASLLAVLLLYLFFQGTREGQAMIAAATDPVAAALVGVNVTRMRIYAFGISFALAVLAGILMAPLTLAGGTSGTPLMLKAFTGAIAGGIHNPAGVIMGCLLVGVLETEVSGAWRFGYRDPVIFAVLILILLFRPQGILAPRARKA